MTFEKVLSGESRWCLLEGDCVEILKGLPENSVDAVVTDPPYELGFMGKDWDKQGIANNVPMWKLVLFVLKPGGHLISFGGTRTYHRMVLAIEDAGFEIRDQLQWLYGSGFPKSLDVSKAIDKATGTEREVVGKRRFADGTFARTTAVMGQHGRYRPATGNPLVTAPATEAARQWDGWGTALKPAHEPIVLARKPLSEPNVVSNVLQWGTGGLNVDGCRIETQENLSGGVYAKDGTPRDQIWGEEAGNSWRRDRGLEYTQPAGRWPANILLSHSPDCALVGTRTVKGDPREGGRGRRPSGFANVGADKGEAEPNGPLYGDSEQEVWACVPGCPIRMLDEQGGEHGGGTFRRNDESGRKAISTRAHNPRNPNLTSSVCNYGDSGGASKFFYVAKASRKEREFGLDGLEVVVIDLLTWGKEAQKVRLLVDTAQSPPRVTAVSTIPSSEGSEWSMFLFGNPTTAPSLLDIPSITVTAANSITESRTLNWLVRSLTNASIVVRSGEMANGGSPVESAVPSAPLLTITSEKTAFPLGVGPVASATLLRISGNASSAASHPTVKPVELMRYLCRLVTPPNGIVLDPFVGSGTTGIACLAEGFKFIGIEKELEYVKIAEKRIRAGWSAPKTKNNSSRKKAHPIISSSLGLELDTK